MDVGEVVTVVVGALIAYIIADTLIVNLITGTSTGDTLIQNVVPEKVGPSESNLCRITGQIRGTLKRIIRHANPELNLNLVFSKCVETRGSAPFGVVG